MNKNINNIVVKTVFVISNKYKVNIFKSLSFLKATKCVSKSLDIFSDVSCKTLVNFDYHTHYTHCT